MVYEDILTNVAIYGAIAVIIALFIQRRFPQYWQILFPSQEQQYIGKLKNLEEAEKELKAKEDYLSKLEDYNKRKKSLARKEKDLLGKE